MYLSIDPTKTFVKQDYYFKALTAGVALTTGFGVGLAVTFT
jgi:hypothetical protein